MHVLQFLKSVHAAPPGGRLHFGKNTEFDCSDFDMCGRRFHRNCRAEFDEAWYNDSIGGVVNARFSIFKIRSFRALWKNIEPWSKILILAVLTFICVDIGFSKTVFQNSVVLNIFISTELSEIAF